MDKKYINPNNPVYFSYAWANSEHTDIEDDVNNLCKLLEDNQIYYKRDKDNLCPYRWSIQKAEEEIGAGSAIIVVISERYLKSEHCMNEWHLIRKNGKIWERVYPIVLENANISNDEIAKKYYQFFNKRRNRIINKQKKGYPPLKTVESEAANAGYYFGALDDMYQFLSDYNRYDIIKIRENNYAVIINQLKEYFQQITNKPNNTKPETTSSIPSFPVSIPKGLLHRDLEVEELYDGIIKNRFFNLVGVGGSGKTSLTYLMMQKHLNDFNQIAYVVVNNHIKDEFVEQINVTLNLPYENGENVIYNRITAFLEENYKSAKPNLLVLDINETSDEAENKKFIEELHEIINNWDILILSREHFSECKIKDLNQKQDKEFVKELFLAKAGDKYNSFEDFDGLFKFIDYTPILAEQLGIYLKPLPKKSLAEIKKVFHGENFREEEIEVGVSAQNRQNTIVSFLEKLIDYNKFKSNAQKLLCHFVLWQAEYIEYNVIKNLLKGVFDSDDDYENALVTLCKRAILTQKDLPDGNSSYKLHGLLAESLREQIDISKQDYSKYLSNIEDIIEYGYYDFMPYADCIGNSLCEYSIVDNYNLLNGAGIKFYDTWKTDYANKLYNKCLKIVSEKVDNDPNNNYYKNGLVNIYNNLAVLQHDYLQAYDLAKNNFENAINILEKLPENRYDYYEKLVTAYNNLAVLQENHFQDYDLAKENYEKAIKIGKLSQGKKGFLIQAYYNLAQLQCDHFGDYNSASDNYKNAIEIGTQLQNNTKHQYHLVCAYNSLAILQKNHLQAYDLAKENYEKAIAIKEQLPKDNPEYQNELARVYNNFANLQENHFQDYDSAKENYQKAIDIREQLPKDNPGYQNDLAGTYYNLAVLQENHFQDYDLAKENYEKAIAIREQLPKDNPEYQNGLALVYNNLARLQEDYFKAYDLAKDNYLKEIEVKKALCNDNPDDQNSLAREYYNLAYKLSKKPFEAYDSAKDNYQKAIEIRKRLPKDNANYQYSLASTHNSFAYLLKDHLKDYEAAKENCNKAIEIAKQLSHNNSEKYGIYLFGYKHSLADVCFDNNEIETAKSILDEIQQPTEKCLEENPDDEWTKTVNDGIKELLEKINNSESVT